MRPAVYLTAKPLMSYQRIPIRYALHKALLDAGIDNFTVSGSRHNVASVYLCNATDIQDYSIESGPGAVTPLVITLSFPPDYRIGKAPEIADKAFAEVISLCRLQMLAR